MEESNTQKIRLIFLPAILMSVFLSGSSILFYQAQNILLSTFQSVSAIPSLKTLVIFPQIILVFTLLIVSGYKSFEKIFKGTLIASIGIITFLSVLVFFQDALQLNGAFLPNFAVQMYEPIIKNWPSALLYISLSLLNFNLFSLLIWGFINRFTTPSEGTKYYIPLTFILGLIGALVTNLGMLFTKGSNWPLMAVILPAIVLMIGGTAMFNYFWKRLPDHFSNSGDSVIESKKKRFPFLTGAYLLAGSVMIEHLLNIFFKSEVKMQFSDPSSYSNFMGFYSISVGLATIITSILWTILGTWLILKRGWQVTALCGSISVLVGGIVFLGFWIVNQSVFWLNQGIMMGLLKGITTSLFFPLVQIIYLYIPDQIRFRTKVLTEMVALPLMKGSLLIIIQWLIIVFGSISAISIYGKIFILILLTLLVAASSIIGNFLKLNNSLLISSKASRSNI